MKKGKENKNSKASKNNVTKRESRQWKLLDEMKKANVQSPQSLVEFLRRRATDRNWKASTTRTVIGMTIGILKRPIRFEHSWNGWALSDPIKDFAHEFDVKAAEERPNFPYAMHVAELEQAIEVALLRMWTTTAVVLIVAWATAARIGDAVRLQAEDISLHPARVRFRAGKGVAQRGQAYTVWTTFGQWNKKIKSAIRSKPGPIVQECQREAVKKQIRDVLREVVPQAELRSVRRGALQTMAKSGVNLDIIMMFSGHKRRETLLPLSRMPHCNRRTRKLRTTCGLQTTICESSISPGHSHKKGMSNYRRFQSTNL